jgi:two-component system, cell cycle sensor histidine kinase and response regulator CckA
MHCGGHSTSQILQAVQRILSGVNARDAMPSGGEMVFATRIVDLDESLRSEYGFEIQPGHYLQIRVVDRGAGMSAEVKRRIFEPFFTTKVAGKGTGMGLASVYGTVKNHRGAIDVHSAPGAGTEFVLYFPVSGANEPQRADAGNLQIPTRLSARVLLIDDEPLVLGAVGRMLEQLGCDVETANTRAEAIAVCETSHDAFDAIILDLIMPGMSGKETFRRLREINPHAPVGTCPAGRRRALGSGRSRKNARAVGLRRGNGQHWSRSDGRVRELS